MTPDQPYLTAAEAAQRLAAAGIQVSEDTLRRWATTGRMPVIKLPSGRFLFLATDVDAIAVPTAGQS